ncbi:MAG: adenylate/guanylate cyclase domain-containing protein [Clostridiales bacterium]|jgi:adenylate cyclase|nr:adenylate/guanylate cyclase domain-containing protein [Clostridiales bacterium]
MNKPYNKMIKRFVSIGVVAVLLLIFLALQPFWMLEHRAQDAAFQRAGSLHPNILVVGIDQQALDMFGPFWQWDRRLMADAINILNSDEYFRPAVIGVDILYSERGLNLEADAALVAAATSGGNVVMASSAEMGFSHIDQRLEFSVIRHMRPFEALLPYVSYGFIEGITDRDGVVRNAPLRLDFAGETIYSFPVALAHKYKEFWGYPAYDILLGQRNETYIRYVSLPGLPGDFFDMSFAEIFSEDFDLAWTYGAIVIIGPYAIGMMDNHTVPIDHSIDMFGVEIHANILQMILDGVFKQYAPAWVGALIIAAFLVLGMAFAEFVDIRIVLAVFAALGIAYYFTAMHVYEQGYLLPMLAPPLALGVVFLYQLVYGYILHVLERARLRTIFKKYVDPDLVDTLIEKGEPDMDKIGVQKHIAVLFVDVRGFTPMTENLRESPELLVQILNEYLELTSKTVFENGGSIDKYIGDATMALFNGFAPQEDYTFKAVKAAWEMVQTAGDLNQAIKERFGVEIGFGIGVHCGEAVVGNIGSSYRKDYTAIGDTINTAARLESRAEPSQVLISREVFNELRGRIQAEFVGEATLKGKALPVEILSLTGIIN